jgi:glycosyltransferase involved in cell wall biosynthesis
MAEITLSLILPTIARPRLARALLSLRTQDWQVGDEVLLVGDGEHPAARSLWDQLGLPGRYLELPGPSANWGHTPRNLAMPLARGSHLLFLDDDDTLTPGAIASIREALGSEPERPHLFRMRYADGRLLWQKKEVVEGNVSTQMIVAPNIPHKLGRWGNRYAGDFDFVASTVKLIGEPIWREEVTCNVRPK